MKGSSLGRKQPSDVPPHPTTSPQTRITPHIITDMANEQLDCALDLMRRMPPADVEDNLFNLIDVVPDLTDDLLSSVDQPIRVSTDTEAGRDFLLCDYNRDGDSYRSPWSSKYFPALEDGEGVQPPSGLRNMEVSANDAFSVYASMYYEAAKTSAYFWEINDTAFAACVLIKQVSQNGGVWDAVHVVEISEQGASSHYKLTSTIMLSMSTENKSATVGGSLTRQLERDLPSASVIANMGSMIEEAENKMRAQLDVVYFGKTSEVVSLLREQKSGSMRNQEEQLKKDLAGALLARQSKQE